MAKIDPQASSHRERACSHESEAAPTGHVPPTPPAGAAGGQRRAEFLPLSRPSIGDAEIDAVVSCLRSGWITSGPRVTEFERRFAETVGAQHAVAVSSATAGLHLAFLATGIERGDEVVTSPLTWASTGNMILAVGARPVFADVDPATLNVDPRAVERAITARTRAIVPVHFAGQPVDLDPLRTLAARHGVALIEDAAHALGTAYRGRPVGGGSTAAVFSFHPIKAITTGEGGMVTTDDADFADRLRLLRFHGITRDAWKRYGQHGTPDYEIVELGYKYNLTDLQAALGIAQLARLEEFVAARTRIAAWYADRLRGLDAVTMLESVPYPARHAWHLLVVRLGLDALRIDRDGVMGELLAANIGVGLHFKALHLHRLYRDDAVTAALPYATAASHAILSLPLFPAMVEDDVRDVVDALAGALSRHAA